MNLDEFRQQNPAYADKSTWPDDKLATGLYNKYYANQMSMADFTKKIGLTQVTPTQDDQLTDQEWQAYADKVEARIKTEDKALEEPWVNPVDAVAGPLGMPARALIGRAIGKGISTATAAAGLRGTAEKVANWIAQKSVTQAAPTAAGTAAAMSASLLAEPVVGTVMEQTEEAMTEADVPLAIKLPVNLATGMITGTLAETGLAKLGGIVKNMLQSKGAKATPEEVFKALKTLKVEGVDTPGPESTIAETIKRPVKAASMADTVKGIAEAKKKKGVDIPEIKAKDIVKSEAGEHLHGAVLGTAAGVQQDEEGVSLDPKLMIGGAIAGAFAGQAVNKLFGSTRHPGQKGGVKATAKRLRKWSNELKMMGKSPKEIFQETGMWQAEDGRWRYEIDDSGAELKKIFTVSRGDRVLADILHHPRLFEQYPQLKDLPVKGPPLNWTRNIAGAFARGDDPVNNVGVLYIDPTGSDVEGTILHEVQHAIQNIEGLERGGSLKTLVTLDTEFRDKQKSLEALLKSASGSSKVSIRKQLRQVKRDREHIGIGHHIDEYDKLTVQRESLNDKLVEIQNEIYEAERSANPDTSKLTKLRKQLDNVRFEVVKVISQAVEAKEAYHSMAFSRYKEIAGEREANAVIDRRLLTAEMRAESYPKFENSVLMSKFLESNVSATTGALGAVYGGVDWATYEQTGQVIIDPNQMLRGLLAGVSVGLGGKAAVKGAEHWANITKTKFIEPLKDIVNGSITNEAVRYQFGLNRSEEVGALVRDYKRNAELVLNKAVALGREINEAAPTGLAQKRLTQILEGGITTNPELAKKAHQINAMFKDLKDATRDMNISQYSRFDELTKRQRADLRNIIKNPDTPIIEAETAQEILNNYYHTGSAKEYLPIFNPLVEGLTKADKKALSDEIKGLKKQSRYMNPEGDQVLEDQIAQLEATLHKGTKPKSRTKISGVTMDQGYSNMRQDMPAEVTQVFNNIIGPSYRVAKGAASQGTDVLKAQLIKEIASNTDWVLPKRVDGRKTKAPANYVKLLGKQWGELNGRQIRKDVLSDLESVIDTRSSFERNMDQYLGYWKFGKAILNPVTHARNAVSNAILAYFAGVNPADTHTYASAAKAIREGSANQYFREAENWGLYNNTFVESDISTVRDELEELRNPSQFAAWIRKAVAMPAALYDQSERFFKTAVFIHQREQGKTVDQAAKHAEEYLFNYQDIPPVVKHYKRWVSPFATYTYKAVPKIAETAITQPWKIGAIMGSAYGLTKLAESTLGVTDEEVAADKKQVLQKKGVTQVLMPFRDSYGNKLYFDLDAFMPWSGIGQTWGQSGIGLGDWLPSHPVFGLASAIMTNRDAYTGKDIKDTVLDSTSEVMAKYIGYAWKQLVPSLAPGGYGSSKLLEGFKNDVLGQEIKDSAGRIKTLDDAILKALLGVKLTPVNQKEFDKFASMKVRKIQQAINKRRVEVRRDLQLGKIDKTEADRLMQSLQTLHKTKVKQVINE